MDYEQIRRVSHTMRAEAVAMAGESERLIERCRVLRERMRPPGRAESVLRIRLSAYRATLEHLSFLGDRTLIEVRISELETELSDVCQARHESRRNT